MSYVKGDRYYTSFEDPILPSRASEYAWLQFSLAGAKEWTDKQVEDTTGKWLIFRSSEAVDRLWPDLKVAIQQGKLGMSMKAATDSSPRVLICVYTENWKDINDIRRILRSLRILGVDERIYYKADAQTLMGISGSIYCSPKDAELLVTAKGKDWYAFTGETLPQL